MARDCFPYGMKAKFQLLWPTLRVDERGLLRENEVRRLTGS